MARVVIDTLGLPNLPSGLNFESDDVVNIELQIGAEPIRLPDAPDGSKNYRLGERFLILKYTFKEGSPGAILGRRE